MEEKKTRLRFYGVPLLLPFVRTYKKRLLIMAGLGILSSLADSLYPFFTGYALNHFVAEGTLQGLGLFLAFYILLMVLQELDNFYCLDECGRIEMEVDRDLRNAAFSHLQTLSFDYFNRNNVGYIHARVMSDTEKIGELVSWRMMDLVWSAAYMVWVIGAMFLVNARLALYVVVLVPVISLVIAVLQRKLLGLNRVVRELNSAITSDFNEGITGVRSIKSLAVEERMDEDFRRDSGRMFGRSVHTARYAALLTSLVTMTSSVVLALVLWRGGVITIEGVMKIGTLSVFMSYAIGLLEPIQDIIQSIAALVGIQVNIERFHRLLEERSHVADRPEVVEKYGDTFDPKRENWEELVGDVEFDDVTFRYPGSRETILDHFSLRVPHGTSVAIVGETGAGKSTLVNLVCRFFEPTEGRILIDGRDARDRSQLWLHSHIGYVLQSPQLFSGTVRDNLRYGNPEAGDDQIMEALRLVSADRLVQGLEGGLDCEVGEGGGRLSTGEKQLLSFTRALLADPRILVLDEATSSVDTVTERLIQEATSAVIRGRTSFVIAHRLSTIVRSDMILAMRDGRIVEQGNHRELMEKRGYYYRLYTRQYRELAESGEWDTV